MNFTYKKSKTVDGMENQVILRSDGACIPFDPANTDYQTFRKEVLAGAELQSAEGQVMTQEQANAFIASLP